MPRAVTILAGVGGATLAVFGLWALQSIVAPVFLAFVLSICVHPLRRFMEQRGVPRGVATGVVAFSVLILLGGFLAALIIAVSQFVALLPQFTPQLRLLGAVAGDALADLGVGTDQVRAIVAGFDPGRLVDVASGFFGGVANLAAGLVVILTTLVLLVVDTAALPTVLRQVRPEREHLVSALESFASGVRRYMVATTALGLAQGVLNAAALFLLGVPGAFLWGMLSFLCSYIPNIGYFIAIIPPTVFAFLTGGWSTAIPVILIYGVINGVVQSVIQPMVIGNAVALSQTITFVSVLFWAAIIGPVGALLAIPMTLLARTILIDADPRAKWWRPMTGDLAETRHLMKAEDVERKARRQADKRKDSGNASHDW